jgi:phage-related protein
VAGDTPEIKAELTAGMDQLVETVDAAGDKVQEFKDKVESSQPELTIGVEDVSAKVSDVDGKISEFFRKVMDTRPALGLDASDVDTKIGFVKALLEGVTDPQTIKLLMDATQAAAKMDDLKARRDDLVDGTAMMRVDAEIAIAQAKLDALKEARNKLADGSPAVIKADAEIVIAQAKLNDLLDKKQSIEDGTLLVKTDAETASTNAKLDALIAKITETKAAAEEAAGEEDASGGGGGGGGGGKGMGKLSGMILKVGAAVATTSPLLIGFVGGLGTAVDAFKGWSQGGWEATSAGQALHNTTEQLGSTMAGLKQSIQDGIFPPVNEAAQGLNAQLKTMGPALNGLANDFGKGIGVVINMFSDLSAGMTQFGKAGLEAFGQGIQPGLQAFDDGMKQVMSELTSSGAAQQAMQSLGKIIGDVLQILPDVISGLVHLAAALGPGLVDIVNHAAGAIQAFADLLTNHKWADDATGAILALWAAYKGYTVIDKVGTSIDKFITLLGNLTKADEEAEGAAEALTAAEGGMDFAALANPIGIAILAIVGIGAAIYEVVQHWPEISKGAKEATNDVKGFFDDLGGHISNNVKSTVSEFKQDFSNIPQLAHDMAYQAGDVFGKGIGEGLKGVNDLVQGTASLLQSLGQNAEKGTVENFKSMGQGAKDIFDDLDRSASDVFGGILEGWAKISQYIPDSWQQAQHELSDGFSDLGKMFQDIGNGIVEFFKEIWDAITAPFQAIAGFFQGIDSGLKSVGINVGSFDDGGVVPGAPGQPQLAIVHGGEFVVSREMMQGGSGVGSVSTSSGGSSAAGGATTIQNQIFLDGKQIQASVQTHTLRQNVRNLSNGFALASGR